MNSDSSTLLDPYNILDDLISNPAALDGDQTFLDQRTASIVRVNWHEQIRTTALLFNATYDWYRFRPWDFLPRAMSFFATVSTSQGVDNVILWLSTTLATLSLVLHRGVDAPAVVALLAAIRDRTPYLRDLSIVWNSRNISDDGHAIVCAALQAFLQGNPRATLTWAGQWHASLARLTLPLDLVVPRGRTWAALGALSSLAELVLSTRTRRMPVSPRRWRQDNPQGGMFLALRALRISAALEEAVALASAMTHRLQALHLCAPVLTASEELAKAVMDIGDTFRVLKELTLNILREHPDERLAWRDMQPLFSGPPPLLEVLHIQHPLPLTCCDAEVEALLRRCSRMRYLVLNPSPTAHTASDTYVHGMTLEAVVAAMEHAPRLAYLGLLVDPCEGARPPTWQRNTELRTLNLGCSTGGGRERARDVARFLDGLFARETHAHDLLTVEANSSEWVSQLRDEFEVVRQAHDARPEDI